MSIDPIADMLTRIRNAGLALHDTVTIPASRLKFELANILQREGYIARVEKKETTHQGELELTLRRVNGILAFRGMKRESLPSKRYYVGANDIPYVYNGLGCAIISTSQGLMTDSEARKAKVGGEVICSIW